MAGIISTATNGVLTGRLHRGVMADPVPDYVIPGARDEMAVTNDGLVVSVAPGSCVIGGCIVDFPITEEVTIAPVAGQKGYIVARLSLTAGTATVVKIQGTAPTITKNSLVDADTGVRDMILAYYTTSGSAITSLVDRRVIGQFSQAQLTSTAAASTADKGVFDGSLAMGQIFDLILDNGNTAASPTITIGNTTYTMTMPNEPKLATSGYQLYKYLKTGDTTLSRITQPDYICEYGTYTSGNLTAEYVRYSSGKCVAYCKNSKGSELTFSASDSLFESEELEFIFPSGFFNAAPECFGITVSTTISVAWGIVRGITSTIAKVAVAKGNNTGVDYTVRLTLIGTWK